MRIYLICGTDTDVGKTQVSASILSQLLKEKQFSLSYKPVQTGCEGKSIDIENQEKLVKEALADHPEALSYYLGHHSNSSYIFKKAVSPHYASALENTQISLTQLLSDLKAYSTNIYPYQAYGANPHDLEYVKLDALVVELAGGLMSPLSDFTTNLDLVLLINELCEEDENLELKLVLVSNNKLGTISHALTAVKLLPRLDYFIFNGYFNLPPVKPHPKSNLEIVNLQSQERAYHKEVEQYHQELADRQLNVEIVANNWQYYKNLQQGLRYLEEGILQSPVEETQTNHLTELLTESKEKVAFGFRRYLLNDKLAFNSAFKNSPFAQAQLVLFLNNLDGLNFSEGKVDPLWQERVEIDYKEILESAYRGNNLTWGA